MKVSKSSDAALPTKYGEFRVHGFSGGGREYMVLTRGDVSGENVLLRIHSACLTGDVFHSLRCDCGDQFQEALAKIMDEDRGMLIYLPHQEGRGIGILNKLKAYELQDKGLDTVEANERLGFEGDERDYDFIPGILAHFKVESVRLLTNNPQKIKALEKHGIRVKRVPLIIPPQKRNEKYLETKKKRMGHMLDR